jgi:hypothetical protein
MSMKSGLKYLGLTVFGALVFSSTASAQSPIIAGSVWTPPALSFNDCMQKGADAIRRAGGNGAQQQTLFAGMGYIMGNFGDYSALISCITFKGTVTFAVAGLDAQTAHNHVRQLSMNMGSPQ